MNLFQSRTKSKHIRKFEDRLIERLSSELPLLRKASKLAKIESIELNSDNNEIGIIRDIKPESYVKLTEKYNNHFLIQGVSLYNKILARHEKIQLEFSFNLLTRIVTTNTKNFHSTFDMAQMEVNNLKTESIKKVNETRGTIEKILSEQDNQKLKLLDLDNTIEIEYDASVIYTIKYINDSKYIAINDKKKVYIVTMGDSGSITPFNNSIEELLNEIDKNPNYINELLTND